MLSTSMSMLMPGARAWQSLSARLQQLPSRQVPAVHEFAFLSALSAPLSEDQVSCESICTIG